MRKFLGLAVAMMAMTAVACSGPEKKDETVENAAVVEAIQEVHVFWTDLDMARPDGEQFYCKFVKVKAEGSLFSWADQKTSGQCKWDEVIAAAGEPAKPFPAENLKAMANVIAGIEFPAHDGTRQGNCATLNVITNTRTFFVNDCNIKDRAGQPFEPAASGAASKSVEEAAFRLNALTIMQ